MVKLIKRNIVLVCCLAILISTFTPLKAKANVIEDTDTIPFIETELVQNLADKYSSVPHVIDEDTVFIPLTEKENINYLIDTENLSYFEAKRLVQERNLQQSNSYAPTSTYSDQVGVVLKRFDIYVGYIRRCEVTATIHVRLRQYNDSPTNRKFMEVYSHGVTQSSSGIFQWATSSSSAVILSNGHLKLNAAGNVTATVDVSFVLDLAAAGFSISDLGAGTTYYVSKFCMFDYTFDPTYPGAILN